MARKKADILTKAKKKTAIARAVIKKGTGNIRINSKSIDTITDEMVRDEIMIPFKIASNILGEGFEDNIDIYVNVRGGGVMGRAEAVKSAIARAIVKYTNNDKLKDAFLSYDRHLLVDDVRRKEPKKALRKGARAKYQKSYR
ncbi:MAG: 30S ribosomal protein S9 [Candidatus Diapherotrites archaeon]|nr:30S ribosomal protein S9 [Candidatus Diapherotrites archaeon]